MSDTINKFSLLGHKLVPQIHIREPGYMCSGCGLFAKHKKLTNRTRCNYWNELDKACFQHGMAHGTYEELARRSINSWN